MQISLDVEPQREREDLAPAQTSAHVIGCVAFQNPEVLFQDFSERPIRDPLAVRQAATCSSKRRWPLAFEEPPEFAKEPCFPDAGLAEQCRESRAIVVSRLPVRIEKTVELGFAPD